MPMGFQDVGGEGGATAETIGCGLKTSFPAHAVAVTPSDSTEFAEPSAIHVGAAGTVVVVPWVGSSPVTFTVPDGGLVPVMVKKVMTGGTASELVRMY